MFNDGVEVYAAAVAASKKYVDETLGGGGGGGGAEVEVINLLDEYEIDLATIALEQNTGGFAGSASVPMWERLTNNRNVVFLAPTDGWEFYLYPSVVTYDSNGVANMVSLNLQTMYTLEDGTMAMLASKFVMVNNGGFTAIFAETEIIPRD